MSDGEVAVVEDDDDDATRTSDDNNNHDNDKGKIVKVIFQRFSSPWNDDTSPTPFPQKTSDLPYGALVSLQLLLQQPTPPPPPHDDDNNEKKTPQSPPPPLYNVVSWEILVDPKQHAEARARVNNATTASTTCTSSSNSNGILYSTYLRERATTFAQNSVKGKRQFANPQEVYDNSKQPKRPQKQKQQSPTTDTTTTTATTTTDQNETTNDDDGAMEDDGHEGDNKVAKARRAKLFAHWLLETFGAAYLQRGSGVLDIAGGKGHLSLELAATGQIPCTVIDPMIRKNESKRSFPIKRDAKRIRKAGGPLPRHFATWFNQHEFVKRHGDTKTTKQQQCDNNSESEMDAQEEEPQEERLKEEPEEPPPQAGPASGMDANNTEENTGNHDDKTNDKSILHHTKIDVNTTKALHNTHTSNTKTTTTATTEGPNYENDDNDNDDDRYLVQNSSCLVGLHPDQVTQDIVEIALKYDKDFAIVPCCVFPSFFPLRQLQDGTRVVTHAQFCQYLQQLDSSLQQAELPFQGRNIVIFRCRRTAAAATTTTQ